MMQRLPLRTRHVIAEEDRLRLAWSAVLDATLRALSAPPDSHTRQRELERIREIALAVHAVVNRTA